MLSDIASRIKDVVTFSVNVGNPPESHLDFDINHNKECHVTHIFHSLGWSDLYEKKDWWDFFGWDRAVRVDLAKDEIREVLTEKKIKNRTQLPLKETVGEIKSQYPFFRKQELAALKIDRHPLHDASDV